MQAFFALPNEAKARFIFVNLPGARAGFGGYTQAGGNRTGRAFDSKKNDRSRNEVSDRVWKFTPQPLEEIFEDKAALTAFVEELADDVTQYLGMLDDFREYQAFMRELSARFLGATSRAFCPELDLADKAGQHVLRFLKYQAVFERDAIAMNAHADLTLITIISEVSEGYSALEMRAGGEWRKVSQEEGTCVIQFGEFVRWVTRGRLDSMMHRVTRPHVSLRERALGRPMWSPTSLVNFVLPPPGLPLTTMSGALSHIHEHFVGEDGLVREATSCEVMDVFRRMFQ